VCAHHREDVGTALARFCPPYGLLDAVITQQAQIIAYIDDSKLLMIATLAAIPLLLVFKSPPTSSTADNAMVAE
jgi:hypothetical protein